MIPVPWCCQSKGDVVEVLFYVHRNRRLIRDGSPGQPPRLSHSSLALKEMLGSVVYKGSGFCKLRLTVTFPNTHIYALTIDAESTNKGGDFAQAL